MARVPPSAMQLRSADSQSVAPENTSLINIFNKYFAVQNLCTYFYHTLKHFDPEAVQPAWQVVESTQPRGLATAQEMGAQVNMEKRPQERVQVASPGHRVMYRSPCCIGS